MRLIPYETSAGGTRADDKQDYITVRGGDKSKTDQCSLDARLFKVRNHEIAACIFYCGGSVESLHDQCSLDTRLFNVRIAEYLPRDSRFTDRSAGWLYALCLP
jgi:hypothetical protein